MVFGFGNPIALEKDVESGASGYCKAFGEQVVTLQVSNDRLAVRKIKSRDGKKTA